MRKIYSCSKFTMLTIVFLLGLSNICFCGTLLTIICSGNNAVVTVVNVGGAKYVGATAFLTDGKYYDFPAQRVTLTDVGKSFTFSLPRKYSATKIVARLWKDKKKSKESWSDLVVNPQGYVMTGAIGESVSCFN